MSQDIRRTMSGPGRPDRVMPALNPTRVWWGLVFITLASLAVLHVIGILDWNQTVNQWWPVAIIGWALAEMLDARRFSATAAIIAATGLGLLADEQHWAGRGIIWSAVFAGIGAAIMFGPARRKASPGQQGASPDGHDAEADGAAAGSPRAG